MNRRAELGNRRSRRSARTVGPLIAGVSALALALAAVIAPAGEAQAAYSTPSEFVLKGAGWGHGVGMSQYGARGQGLDGRTAKQILEHYYAPATVVNTDRYASNSLRVQLHHVRSTTVTPNNGRLRVSVDGGAKRETSNAIRLEYTGGDVVVSGGVSLRGKDVNIQWQNTRYWTSGTANTTVSVSGADAGGTGIYRHGRLRVTPLESKANVVNVLRVNDEYLYGLAEMPSLWPAATLQSQVIAGRTYAMRNMASIKPECACHVYDEVKSQKFSGWKKESEGPGGEYGAKWKAAVDATHTRSGGVPVSARVIHYGGGLIDALYFSSSGGMTRDASSVWANSVPYLKSRSDPWSQRSYVGNPNSSWTERVSQSAMSKAFGLKNVKTVALSWGADKAVSTATATSVDGVKRSMSGTQLRSALGIKSAWVFEATAVAKWYGVDRLSGDDRYRTAVEASKHSFPSGADTVYVATGSAYADALVAAPAATRDGGPLLLTKKTYVPGVVRSEIDRLGPRRIVVVGGVDAVSTKVEQDLRALAPTTRRGGADRYETAVAISEAAFGSANRAYVATGRDFPDALSASSVAAAQGRPVFLVDGTASKVRVSTLQALDRMGVDHTIVAGGPVVVSSGIMSSLAPYDPVRRYGADRYATNRSLNRDGTPGYDTGRWIYLATGGAFPDALAGAAVAGTRGSALYLSKTGCIPQATLTKMDSQSANRVFLLGGTAALTGDVARLKAC
ncbi:cell wall-binding repeat-containing protein [Zhihengliuella halotolerans]|uniref:SpoIID/LytB domain protein n=1 Tax=Zhihengliuella halotolerans TaxID=370736 RepID=A0A4Q8ABQ3_9MICC|nr:cell wall-binding repeat-containing protein [Zhihengliuella halotolerans]RZU61607.1 SpoIID/LytB domain protein [Zhihengliuella halotolerans]